jgi:hypothetical protein
MIKICACNLFISRKNISHGKKKSGLIESGLANKLLHQVAITYITGTLTLFAIIGAYKVLAERHATNDNANNAAQAFTLKMQPNLSVISYKSKEAPVEML